jgi:hypothetical protein
MPVAVTDAQQQTVQGQDFTFFFNSADGLLAPAAGQGGTVLVELTNVDLSVPQAYENFNFDIESLATGGPIAGADLDSISDSSTVRSIDGSISFDIGASALEQILSDMTFTALVDFTANTGFNNRDPVLVSLTLAYEGSDPEGSEVIVTPIPAAVWLFGSALGLLGWVRSRAA